MRVALPNSYKALIAVHNYFREEIFLDFSHGGLLSSIISPVLDNLLASFHAFVAFECANSFVIIFHLVEYGSFNLHLKEIYSPGNFFLVYVLKSA